MGITTPILKNGVQNYIINGGMDYWQRGTTATVNLTGAGSTSAYVADRMKYTVQRTTNNQNYTFSRSTDIPAALVGDVLYSLNVTSNQAHTFSVTDGIAPAFTLIEGLMSQGIHRSDTLYISSWFKSSATGTVPIVIKIQTAVGVFQTYVATTTYTAANTWQLLKIQVPLPGVELLRDSNYAIIVSIAETAASSSPNIGTVLNAWESGSKSPSVAFGWATNGGYVRMTGLRLSVTGHGDFARAGGDLVNELMACQRYYETTTFRVNEYKAQFSNNTFFGQLVGLKVNKRATPSIGFSNSAITFHWVQPGTQRFSADNNANQVYFTYGTDSWALNQVRQAGNAAPTIGNLYSLESGEITVRTDADY